MSEIKAGDVVEWTSQAQGSSKTKHGTVLEIVKQGQRPPVSSKTPKSQIKFESGTRNFERVLVSVPRGGKSEISDYYCPRLGAVTKDEDGDK